MVRLGNALGVKLTVWVVLAGTVTVWLTVIGVPPPGGVMVGVTVPVCAELVLLVMSLLTVSAELLRLAVSFCTTRALPSVSAASTRSWTGNWMPVLLSGGIWFQSTSSSVNIVFGSLGLTSMASEFVPDLTSFVTLKLNVVDAPGTAADADTSVPLTQTLAEPITPFTISVAVWPDWRSGVKSVRHHQGTSNSATVSAPIVLMEP